MSLLLLPFKIRYKLNFVVFIYNSTSCIQMHTHRHIYIYIYTYIYIYIHIYIYTYICISWMRIGYCKPECSAIYIYVYIYIYIYIYHHKANVVMRKSRCSPSYHPKLAQSHYSLTGRAHWFHDCIYSASILLLL